MRFSRNLPSNDFAMPQEIQHPSRPFYFLSRDRESEKFQISTRLAAGTEVTFVLAYEELLQRHQGQYQLMVSLRPGQLVRKLTVEIAVSERTGIAYVHIPPLRTSRASTNNQTSMWAVRGDTKDIYILWMETLDILWNNLSVMSLYQFPSQIREKGAGLEFKIFRVHYRPNSWS